MSYRLTPRAEADVETIAGYIAETNPSAAVHLVEKFMRRWQLLATQPRSGALRSDLGADIRHVVVGNYLTFYRIDGQQVSILRVLHGKRGIDPDDLDV